MQGAAGAECDARVEAVPTGRNWPAYMSWHTSMSAAGPVRGRLGAASWDVDLQAYARVTNRAAAFLRNVPCLLVSYSVRRSPACHEAELGLLKSLLSVMKRERFAFSPGTLKLLARVCLSLRAEGGRVDILDVESMKPSSALNMSCVQLAGATTSWLAQLSA